MEIFKRFPHVLRGRGAEHCQEAGPSLPSILQDFQRGETAAGTLQPVRGEHSARTHSTLQISLKMTAIQTFANF